MTDPRDQSFCDETRLKQLVADCFPAHPYNGQVMAVLHDPSVYESEWDNLDLVLAGKKWTDLDQAFVDAAEDEFVLMHPDALRAFLAAWLCRAVDDLAGSNDVRSSLACHLSIGHPSLDWTCGLIIFTYEQKHTLWTLLNCAASFTADREDEQIARKAMEKLENWFPDLTTPINEHRNYQE